MAVASGELRHRLTLYAPEGTYGDGTAQNIHTGLTAKIRALSPAFQQRERLALGGQRTETLYVVDMRYNADIREDFQLLEECCLERTFHILVIVPDDKLEWLELTCVVGPRAAV